MVCVFKLPKANFRCLMAAMMRFGGWWSSEVKEGVIVGAKWIKLLVVRNLGGLGFGDLE